MWWIAMSLKLWLACMYVIESSQLLVTCLCSTLTAYKYLSRQSYSERLHAQHHLDHQSVQSAVCSSPECAQSMRLPIRPLTPKQCPKVGHMQGEQQRLICIWYFTTDPPLQPEATLHCSSECRRKQSPRIVRLLVLVMEACTDRITKSCHT